MESKETTERTHRAGSKKAVRKEMLLQSCLEELDKIAIAKSGQDCCPGPI